MGWLYPYDAKTKEGAINYAFNGFDVIEKSVRGNQVYALCRTTGGIKYILVILLSKSSEYGTWGYKRLDETAMPYYFNCPKKYIKRADPPLNENAKKWRNIVMTGKAQDT